MSLMKPFRTNPQVEVLGSRDLLAATIFYDASAREVVVLGTNARDQVFVTDEGHDEITITCVSAGQGRVQQTFDEDLVDRVRFEGRAGHDYFLNDTHTDSFVRGGVGRDTLSGGSGDDTLSGGENNDLIAGRKGADYLYGLAGADVIYGGHGRDYVDGGANNDTVFGGSCSDIISGGSGKNVIFFDDDDNVLVVGKNTYFDDDDDYDPYS